MWKTTKQDIHSYGASPSTPLLGPAPPPHPPPSPPPGPEEPIRSIPRHRLRLRKLLLVLLFISLLTPLYTIFKLTYPHWSWPWPWPSFDPRPPSIPWKYYSRQYTYGLTPNSTSDDYTLSLHEFIIPDYFPLGVKGSVKLLTGKPNQSHNLLIYIQVFSNFASPVDCIIPSRIIVPNTTENITITSIPNKFPVNRKPTDFHDFQTFVNVYVYTRPQPAVRLGHVSVSTNLLDITIPRSGVKLETSRLSLTSGYRSITNNFPGGGGGHVLDPLYASHISLYSRYNCIGGNWAYGLSFSAAAPEYSVNIFLYPRQISWGAYTPADIDIVAKHDISVLTPTFKPLLSLRNSSISILSHRGNVNGNLVTSTFTNVTALEGNIHMGMTPYWELIADGSSPPNTPRVETYSKYNTSVYIDRPVNIGGQGGDPFAIMQAKHVAQEGNIMVRYPDGFWEGRVDVESIYKKAEILGVDGEEMGGVVREAEGKVHLKGENEVSFVSVVGGGDAVFRLLEGDLVR
ncbi:hypothetical protein TWF718_009507 [Orbilia javanica]|uniref:Uncharacterized protein n=1 Tax=Orbilia javanica TaxID=47235 RepID=A0AAN8RAI8_9PEZI